MEANYSRTKISECSSDTLGMDSATSADLEGATELSKAPAVEQCDLYIQRRFVSGLTYSICEAWPAAWSCAECIVMWDDETSTQRSGTSPSAKIRDERSSGEFVPSRANLRVISCSICGRSAVESVERSTHLPS